MNQGFIDRAVLCGVSLSIASGLSDYLDHHCEPGGFLTAVLRNDLVSAVSRADSENLRKLPEIVVFIRDYLPAICYGSPEKVAAWTTVAEPVTS